VLGETKPATPNGSPVSEVNAANTGVPSGDGGPPVRVSDVLGETTPSATQPGAVAGPPAEQTPPVSVQGQAGPPESTVPAPVDSPAETSVPGSSPAPAQPGDGGAPARVEDVLPGSSSRPAGASAADAPPPDGTVRVAYVPEVVKNQIKEEVKDEVIAEARKEGWGEKEPDWVKRFDLYGDIRVRFDAIINHSTNQATGGFPNFNAINTGAPFDTAGNVYSPQYDVNQNRDFEQLRARLGAAIDLNNGFTAGFRIATGNSG
jgi:hypothetical protein